VQKYDATTLAQNLNCLAEVFEKKPVTAKALEVWFDTLKEFPTEKVMDTIIHWPKTHAKFPVPSEVWKSCNERSIVAREDKNAIEREENKAPVSTRGAEHIRRIMKMLAKPQCSPREFWEKRLATAPRGSIGHQYAREVLKKWNGGDDVYEREPGQDDEVQF
jgi:hypothetical protein